MEIPHGQIPARPIRILITIHRLSFGGADRVTAMLASAFASAGMEVRIAVLRPGGEGEASLRRLLDERVEVRSAGPRLRSRHLELLRGHRFIRRQCRAWKPDVVLASSNNMGLVTGLAVRGLGVGRPRLALKFTNPVVRPRDWGAPRIWYRKKLYRFVTGLYDRVLTLSEQERFTLMRLYPDHAKRFRTVVNPYVSDAMLLPREEPSLPRRRRIVACGRFMPQKRFDRLIDAFARADLDNTELLILGDGPLRPRIERQIVALGLEDRVLLGGFVEDVVPWLRAADLLALSSDYEGLPAIVFEALACGLPVVTTSCFEAAHDLLDGASRCAVVARDDGAALASSLREALRSPPDRDSLRQIALPYSIERSLSEHVAEITDLV